MADIPPLDNDVSLHRPPYLLTKICNCLLANWNQAGGQPESRGTMSIRSLRAGLTFRGNVTGQRQKYYVFEGGESFFVFSFSRSKPKSGYFNMVNSESVTYVRRLTRGQQGVTAQSLQKRSRKPKLIGSALEALNILYVLVATGDAKIDRRHKSKQLFFNVTD
jgi:hypothetical protein